MHWSATLPRRRMGIFSDTGKSCFYYFSDTHSPSLKFHKQLQPASLLDTWRECNHSIIDHIFIPVVSSLILLSSHIHPIPLSDHCAVITSISSLIQQSRDRTWCINKVHLTNKSYCFDIQLALKEYLLHNTTPDISPVLLWDTHKPVILLRYSQNFVGGWHGYMKPRPHSL